MRILPQTTGSACPLLPQQRILGRQQSLRLEDGHDHLTGGMGMLRQMRCSYSSYDARRLHGRLPDPGADVAPAVRGIVAHGRLQPAQSSSEKERRARWPLASSADSSNDISSEDSAAPMHRQPKESTAYLKGRSFATGGVAFEAAT